MLASLQKIGSRTASSPFGSKNKEIFLINLFFG